MIRSILLAMAGVASFAVLFHAPAKSVAACAVCGGLGVFVSRLLLPACGLFVSSAAAAFVVALANRLFAKILKMPTIVFLVPGLFPLVPGAGIYHAAYALLRRDLADFGAYALEVLTVAAALAVGVLLGARTGRSNAGVSAQKPQNAQDNAMRR